MKKPHSKLAITAAAAALLVLGAPKAEADGGERLISYAHTLEDTVANLNVELREHYSQTSVFRTMLTDTAMIQAEAEHIDQLAHNPYSSLIQLLTDIREVDKYVHHLSGLVDATARGRYGRVLGDPRHVHNLIEYMDRIVHSLEAEVENIRLAQRSSRSNHGQYSHESGHNDQHSNNQSYSPPRSDPRLDPRNINNYMNNQWNGNSPRQPEPQREQNNRNDPRVLFNLFRNR